MNRLIKAEWYRIRKSSKLMMWLIFMAMLTALFPMIDLFTALEEINAMQYLAIYEINAMATACLFMGIMTATMVAMNFYHKTSFYEVMQGNKIHHIILSKIIVDGLLSLVMLVIGFFAGFIYLAIKNGIGTTHYKAEDYEFISATELDARNQWVLRAVLFSLLMINMLIIAILIILAVRRAIGIALVFFFFEFETMIELSLSLFLKEMIGSDSSDKVLAILFSHRMMNVTDTLRCIDTYTIVSTIVMFLVDVVVLYLIAYNGYKKQKFK